MTESRLALHRAGQANTERLIESFNGRLRDKLLTETLFSSMNHARAALTTWHKDYNTEHPHSRLGWQTPSEFAQTFTPHGG